MKWMRMSFAQRLRCAAVIGVMAPALAACEASTRLADYTASLGKQSSTSRYAALAGREDIALPVALVAKARRPQRVKKAKAAPPRIPLTSAEIERALIGNSIYAGAGEAEFAALHRPGGALAGRTWTSEGSENGQGSWKVAQDGTYCRKWDNSWGDGRWGCFKIFRKGSELVMERVAGTGSEGTMLVMPGNAYGL